MIALFRLEVTTFHRSRSSRAVFFFAQESVAMAVYETWKKQSELDGKVRGIFLDRLTVADADALATALMTRDYSRHELEGLTPVYRNAEAF